jgi:hypothetical protein
MSFKVRVNKLYNNLATTNSLFIKGASITRPLSLKSFLVAKQSLSNALSVTNNLVFYSPTPEYAVSNLVSKPLGFNVSKNAITNYVAATNTLIFRGVDIDPLSPSPTPPTPPTPPKPPKPPKA